MRTFQSGSTFTKFEFVRETTRWSDVEEFLSELSWPETRHVLFAASTEVTALVHNGSNGSDYSDYVVRIPRHLNCRFARILNRPQRVWKRGALKETLQWGARIFQLHDVDGSVIRSVSCMNDGGRWAFHASGTPHPIEATFNYDSTPNSRRFPSEQLQTLAAAFGFPVPDGEALRASPRFVLFHQPHLPGVTTCTIEEADDPAFGYYRRGLGWVPHMQTHAPSVIADFERCIRLNPRYEPLVRAHLAAARRIVGQS
jgi:hypothetical protein